MRFSLNINCDNAAFADHGREIELARILRNLAAKVEAGADAGLILDIYGNRVGRYRFSRRRSELIDDDDR